MVDEFFRLEAIAPFMLNQRRDYLCVVQGADQASWRVSAAGRTA